jgi:hypothetical protein
MGGATEEEWNEDEARSLCVDVQEDHYWVEARQWQTTGDSRQLYFGKVADQGDIERIREQFSIQPRCVFVDVRHQRSVGQFGVRPVYAMIVERGYQGLSGDNRKSFLWVEPDGRKIERFFSRVYLGDPGSGTKEGGRRWAKCYHFASHSVKNILARLRDGKGAKWLCIPDKEYTRQMHAEQLRVRRNKITGRDELVWHQTRRDNHAWDLGQMGVVFALMHPKITGMSEVIEQEAKQEKGSE